MTYSPLVEALGGAGLIVLTVVGLYARFAIRHPAGSGIRGRLRSANRAALVVGGTAIIVWAIVDLVGTVVDGGATQIAWAAVRSILLGGVGAVVARAGVRHDASDGTA